MRLIAILTLSLAVSACSSLRDSVSDSLSSVTDIFSSGTDPREPNELLELKTSLKKEVIWEVDTGVGTEGQYVNLQPVIIDELILVADREGLVQARKLSDGDLVWEKELEIPLSAGVGVSYQSVFVGSSDGQVVSLALEDGTELWKAKVPSEVLAVPQTEGDVVVIRTIDGQVLGLDEDTGEQRWTYKQPVPPLSLRGTSAPVLFKGAAICGFARGRLVAIRLDDGIPIWETAVAIPRGRSEMDRLIDLDADPVIDADTLFVASFQGGIAAMMLANGELLWRQADVSLQSGLALDWQALYLSDEKGDVWVLDRENGEKIWKQDALHFRELTTPALYRDTLVVGDFEGYLHWLSQETGDLLDRLKISEGRILAKPLVVDSVLYAYASDGTLIAITVK